MIIEIKSYNLSHYMYKLLLVETRINKRYNGKRDRQNVSKDDTMVILKDLNTQLRKDDYISWGTGKHKMHM